MMSEEGLSVIVSTASLLIHGKPVSHSAIVNGSNTSWSERTRFQMLYNGVTRATRIAKLVPGTLVRVEVIGKLPRAFAGEPKIGDLLP